MANQNCNDIKPGMSVNLEGECITDCKTAEPTENSSPTTNTPGYHENAGKCLPDT